jgi:radical SAM superfamily enzyme YgiQ (UPF0313 family)
VSRVLLVSTYELGAQPVGLASVAGPLRSSGHEVRTADLAIEEFDEVDFSWPDAVGFSVPMHTALRLALAARSRLAQDRPELPACFFGLYADAARLSGKARPQDLFVAGEAPGSIGGWLDGHLRGGGETVVELGRVHRDRSPSANDLLLPLDRYARFVVGDSERLVGTVETTRGCNHRCRHCPVPVVYGGRSRVVDETAVLDQIDGLVARGAGHIRFADPDFLNRPAHALRIATQMHGRHPELSFDATVKVEHLLRQRDTVGRLARLGLAFVVSAFESTNDAILERLDKGHRADDASRAVRELRAVGVEIRPSFLPFTPWSVREDLVDILDFVAVLDLVDNVDAVQYTIRLLVPPGSLLLDLDDATLHTSLGAFDRDALSYSWRSKDGTLDDVQRTLARLVEEKDTAGAGASETYDAVRAAVYDAFELSDPGRPAPQPPLGPPASLRPRLTEAWFCCAEPTRAQIEAVAPVAMSAVASRDR